MKSFIKWVLGLLVLLLLLIFGAYHLGLRKFLIDRVQEKLLNAINQDPSRLYDITCSTADVNLSSGNIVVYEVYVTPRQHIVDSIYQQQEVVRMLLELKVEKISLSHLNIRQLLLNEHIDLDNIEIHSPELEILLNPATELVEDKSLIQEIFIPEFSISLDNFDIINASAIIDNVAFQDSFFMALDSFNLHVDNIYIDSSSFDGPIEENFGNLIVEARNLRSPAIDIYQMEAEKMSFDLSENRFKIEEINLKPSMDKQAYGRKNNEESDWLEGTVKAVELHNFDLSLWHASGKIHYEKISITQPELYVFRDKRLPDPNPSATYLPPHMLRNVPLTFRVDTIEIKQGNVTYEEHHEGYDIPSRMVINDVYGSGYRLTNDSIYWSSNGHYEMDLKARLWNDGHMHSHMRMPLYGESDNIEIVGKVSDLQFEKMNEFFEHTLYLRFESGSLHSLNFSLDVGDKAATGSVDINYSDLKIEVLGLPNAADKSGKKKNRLYSFLANTVVPKNYHPQSRHYKQGYVSVLRPRDKSIFKYMAVCMQDGIVSCMTANVNRKKRKEKRRKH